MIERSNGCGIVLHRGKYRVTYFENGERKQKFTGTSSRSEAEAFRDAFLKNAIVRENPNRYIYKQGKKWTLCIKGKVYGRYESIDLAQKEKEVVLKFNETMKNSQL